MFELTLQDLRKSINGTLSYKIDLSPENLSATPNVKSVSTIDVKIDSFESDFGYSVDISISGVAKIIDDYSFEEDDYHFNTNETIELSTEEDSDIEFNNGKFDFLPIVLALYFDSIPLCYHKDSKMDNKNSSVYELIDEDEYNRRKKERNIEENNPFAKLKDLK